MYCSNSSYWLAPHLIGLLLLEASISALGAAAAPEITGNPRVVLAKSTAKPSETVTITLGAASAYLATAKPTAPLTGVNIAFASEDSVPSQGVDVFLSDQLVSNVKDSVSKDCNDQSSPDCQKSVQAVLESRDVGIEARGGGILVGGLINYVAVIIPHVYTHDRIVPAAIHLKPDDISQISSVASATEIRVATASNDATAFLVTQVPAPTTAPGPIPSISTVSAASGNLHAGDVVVRIPPELVRRVSDFTGITGHCLRGYKKEKRVDFNANCLQNNVETFILNAMPGRTFDTFFYMQGAMVRIGNTARADYVQALNNARGFAVGLAGQLHVDKKKALALGTIAFGIMYKIYVDGTKLTEEVVFQASEIATRTGGNDDDDLITSAPSATSTSSCPSDAPKTDGDDPLCCQDKGCQGDEEIRTCAKGDYRGCPCLNLVTYPLPERYDSGLVDLQKQLFATLFARDEPVSSTQSPTTATKPDVDSVMRIMTMAYSTPTATGLVNWCESFETKAGKIQCDIFCAPRPGTCVHTGNVDDHCKCS